MIPHVPAVRNAPNFLPSEKLTSNLQKLHSHAYGPSTGISTPDVNSHVLSSTRTPRAGLVQRAHAVLAASAQEQRSREPPAVGKAQPALLLWSVVLSWKRHPGGWKHPTSLTLARRGPGDGTAPPPVPQPAAGARQHRRPELEEALAEEQRMATLGEHGASPEAHTHTLGSDPACYGHSARPRARGSTHQRPPLPPTFSPEASPRAPAARPGPSMAPAGGGKGGGGRRRPGAAPNMAEPRARGRSGHVRRPRSGGSHLSLAPPAAMPGEPPGTGTAAAPGLGVAQPGPRSGLPQPPLPPRRRPRRCAVPRPSRAGPSRAGPRRLSLSPLPSPPCGRSTSPGFLLRSSSVSRFFISILPPYRAGPSRAAKPPHRAEPSRAEPAHGRRLYRGRRQRQQRRPRAAPPGGPAPLRTAQPPAPPHGSAPCPAPAASGPGELGGGAAPGQTGWGKRGSTGGGSSCTPPSPYLGSPRHARSPRGSILLRGR